MNQKICPYPGLRPFTEEESVYFKGRDADIEQITGQLSDKKFLMLTGASGDGKSSLVYAGVIPNARAGFFKAKYNNWIVADFRPERNPLQNMSMALNKYFGLPEKELERELSFGFSSLVDIYKKSKYYINQDADKWQKADETERKKIKREAANLLILADQFEEFFTNPENYSKGAPSLESQTVVNLLVETSKIAQEADVPIYIICTMRSDYIGQCAAFRGLPEMIGYSQFFVPRLKRKEIQQVIEEPAILNGDKISPRLTEVLINELNDGFDQLPVLQHTLNAIWNIAGKGSEEMDLIHLAMLAGIAASTLPKADQEIFNKWHEDLPEFRKKYFKDYSLGHVLAAHADTLAETADLYYTDKWGKYISGDTQKGHELSREDAGLIIKTAFQCLTKIDESRAVRNRMTLQEITNVINKPNLTTDVVGKVLNLFREQGNTFLVPFITDSEESKILKSDAVLDITHESLIRNWSTLGQWASEEHNNVLVFQDFNKQLSRWVKNGYSKGYLLPIGPLTFFEGWYNKLNPNKYWLARYDESDAATGEKIQNAEKKLADAGEFLKKSARNLFFSRTVLKYGANKLITWLAIVAFICTCTFYYFDFRQKQNSHVLEDLEETGTAMLKNSKIANKTKADFVISYERLNPGTFKKVLESLNNDTISYDIAMQMILAVQNIDDDNNTKVNPLIFQLVDYLDIKLTKIYSLADKIKGSDNYFKRFEQFVRLCGFIKTYDKTSHSSIDQLIKKYIDYISSDYIMYKLNQHGDSITLNPLIFNPALELALCYIENKKEFATKVLSKLSPFENPEAAKRFNVLYPKNKSIPENQHVFTHNAGYQELAYLYAVNSNPAKIISCFDSIIKYNPDYKDYTPNFDEIALYVIQNPEINFIDINQVLEKYESYVKLPHLKYIRHLSYEVSPNTMRGEQILHYDVQAKIVKDQIWPWSQELLNFIYFAVQHSLTRFYDYYLEETNKPIVMMLMDSKGNKMTYNDEKDGLPFRLALYYKQLGIYTILNTGNNEEGDKYFKKAFDYYSSLPKEYLDGDFFLGMSDAENSETKKIKRSVLFLYPNPIIETTPWYADWAYFVTTLPKSFCFLDYMMKHVSLSVTFYSKDEYKMYQEFLYQYYANCKWNHIDSMNYSYFDLGLKLAEENQPAKGSIDTDFINLVSALKYFKKDDTAKAMSYYRKINHKRVLDPEFQKGETHQSDAIQDVLISLAEQFAIHDVPYIPWGEGDSHPAVKGNMKEAFSIVSCLSEPYLIRNALINISYKLQEKGPVGNSFIYLDSLYADIDKSNKFGMKLILVNGMIGGRAMEDVSMKLIKDADDKFKPRALTNFIRGVAYNGFYRRALQNIPGYISSDNELQLYTEILNAQVRKKLLHPEMTSQQNSYSKYDKDTYGDNYDMNDLEYNN